MDPVREIAQAVLYEGYVLWPYRRSSIKNQQRFTFGCVYPSGWPNDRSEVRSEVLLESDGDAEVEVCLRFLQVVRRQPLRDGRPVDELLVGSERHVAWEEAREREFAMSRRVSALPQRIAVEVAAGQEREELEGGALVRSWQGLQATLIVGAERLEPGLVRISAALTNDLPWSGEARAEALHRTLCSAHIAFAATGAGFVSQTDPPPALAAVAAECRNDGLWPVLVGEPGERDRMLASPIILEDHPRIAPESPGDLFDNAEIDGLLTLSILGLSDEEKDEMRAADPRTRAILERAESLSREQLMRLHGTIRELRPLS